jgi:4-phytase/acid phosphatase
MKTHLFRLLTIPLLSAFFLTAQSVDDTQLKQVIIFGRHNVRAPVTDNDTLDHFSVHLYPDFKVPTGYLTPNGETLETILGGYYRLWLTNENLLTGNDTADAANVYFRANVIQRTIDSAQHFALGLLPAATVNVKFYGPNQSDPLFDAVGAGVAHLDQQTAIAAVSGRLGGNPQSLATAYAAELALTRSILLDDPGRGRLLPVASAGTIDVTAIPFAITAGSPVCLGGLADVAGAVDPFIMEYANGMSAAEVGWGRLTANGISQTSRLYALDLDLQCRTPYLASVESSNLASHVVRSMVQAATGNAMTGSLGTPATKVIVLVASDSNISALAGMFHVDWVLPGYPPDFCSPGGALVFELRQSQSTGEYIVRLSYISQTLDQLRNLTRLTLAEPPAIAPVFIPGCSTSNATFDCPLAGFVAMGQQVIDPQSTDLLN